MPVKKKARTLQTSPKDLADLRAQTVDSNQLPHSVASRLSRFMATKGYIRKDGWDVVFVTWTHPHTKMDAEQAERVAMPRTLHITGESFAADENKDYERIRVEAWYHHDRAAFEVSREHGVRRLTGTSLARWGATEMAADLHRFASVLGYLWLRACPLEDAADEDRVAKADEKKDEKDAATRAKEKGGEVDPVDAVCRISREVLRILPDGGKRDTVTKVLREEMSELVAVHFPNCADSTNALTRAVIQQVNLTLRWLAGPAEDARKWLKRELQDGLKRIGSR